jgi:hypothetical protein
MEMTIEEGRLVELPTPGATGMDRRAFGEFVGVGGELASYAFGWTTAAHPHVAHLTVGIGAGNPGGATFHAVLFPDGDGYAFSLVDEPFEDVPEGGPDLAAADARAHPDIDFVWWVADCVMERDRRAWWMVHWLLGTGAIQTPQVFALHEPVLLVSHDADDVLWQLIGTSHAGEDGTISHLCHAVDEDATLLDVLDLAPGEQAVREHAGGPWTRGA